MITKEMLFAGIQKGVVTFIDSPNDGAPACKIGDYWFYYAGEEGESESSAEYIAHTPGGELVREVMDALNGIRDDEDENEYLYYEAVLRENGCASKLPYKVRIVETYSRTVVVWARTGGEALDVADSMCDSGEIDMERNCYDGREITVEGIAGESDMKDLYVYNEDGEVQ